MVSCGFTRKRKRRKKKRKRKRKRQCKKRKKQAEEEDELEGISAVQTRLPAMGAYKAVAKTTGLKPKDVGKAVEGLMCLAAAHLKTKGGFTNRGLMSLKLHKKNATLEAARKVWRNAKTKKACITKATSAYKKVSGSSACNRFQGLYD